MSPSKGPKATWIFQVRLASTPLILREYLPRILTALRQRFPDVLFSLAEGSQRETDHRFAHDEADFIINVLKDKLPPGCRAQRLLSLPMVLLVPQASPVRSLKDLLKLDRRQVHLLSPDPHDAITRGFRQGLARWPVGWSTLIHANSLELIEAFASEGHGIGVSVLVPGRRLPPGVRTVALPEFPKIHIAAVWRGPKDSVVEAILEQLKKRAMEMKS